MNPTSDTPMREVADLYDEPGMRWALRSVGTHLHPGGEDVTVALAARAESFGLEPGGRILEIASALGGPARYLARRFGATVLCVDGDPRMQTAALAAGRREGVWRRCPPLLARTERLPLAGGCCDAAWSQDALCHMDKPPVLRETARVLSSGAIFAFTDWIARAPLTTEDQESLARLWAFPSLLRLAEYVALLDATGFDVLFAEDRTRSALARPRVRVADQEAWEQELIARFGPAELARQHAPAAFWVDLMQSGRGGHGMFVARRR